MIKCQRYSEAKEKNDTRGQKRPMKKKFLIASGIFLFLMFPLWFPLTFFAYKEELGQSQTISSAHINMQFGSHEPFYTSSSVESNIHQFTQDDMARFKHVFAKNHQAKVFLDGFEASDVAAASFYKFSSKIWELPPPTLESIKENLAALRSRFIHFKIQVLRNSVGSTGKDIINEIIELRMPNDLKENLSKLLSDDMNITEVEIPLIFKKFNLIRNIGKFANTPELTMGPNGELNFVEEKYDEINL